ncbi:GLPGLI family protein [Sphingobacterium spiritivorum]|uniref:GLPGLI family protein n=1 Tax=Sphingobacterium spiritivorum TaxID=258 RepID=UPI00191819B9|nr:GLPGLI family protein [Sphingobacterium spiritivorum]QQT26049.1 GLPGLI family protein [Sphingobacterium spiritivorum]
MKTNLIKQSICLIFLFLIAVTTKVSAQEYMDAYVRYAVSHLADSTRKDSPIKQDMYVYVSPNYSYYSKMQPETFSPNQMTFSYDNIPSDVVDSYLYNKSSQEYFKMEFAGNLFRIKTEKKSIDWDIKDEEKEIGGYKCIKAVGTFGGRTYEAWYTPELPYAYGPWKLDGLPGLILEAKDLKSEVIFAYSGFNKMAEKFEFAKLYEMQETTAEKIAKAKKAMEADMLTSVLASVPAGSNVTFKGEDGKDISKEEAEMLIQQHKKKQAKEKSFELNNPAEINK